MKRIICFCIICITVMLTACGANSEVPVSEPAPEVIQTIPAATEPVCEETLPEAPVLFREDITFAAEYVSSEELMPYGLFTPSTAAEFEKIPLIVFLHGRGERNTHVSWFMHYGISQVLNEWSLEGFNAYVLCPQLYGKWNCEAWNNETASGYVMDLLESFVAGHNVDMDRIYMTGFSAGGLGAVQMVQDYPDYFRKMIVLSPPEMETAILEEIPIPTLGCSEAHVNAYSFMRTDFPSVFGLDNVRFYDAFHSQLVYAAFTEDLDGNNRSDLLEWLLCDLPIRAEESNNNHN